MEPAVWSREGELHVHVDVVEEVVEHVDEVTAVPDDTWPLHRLPLDTAALMALQSCEQATAYQLRPESTPPGPIPLHVRPQSVDAHRSPCQTDATTVLPSLDMSAAFQWRERDVPPIELHVTPVSAERHIFPPDGNAMIVAPSDEETTASHVRDPGTSWLIHCNPVAASYVPV